MLRIISPSYADQRRDDVVVKHILNKSILITTQDFSNQQRDMLPWRNRRPHYVR